MNKEEAELVLEKEKLRKEKIKKRMHEYRTNPQFRKKNADYMKEYRLKQKKILEEANNIIINQEKDKKLSENIKKKSEKTIKKYISIINKNHKLFNKTGFIDNKLLYKLYTENLEDSEEIIITNDLSYLKDLNKFIEILKNKYQNNLTLRSNLNPYLLIYKTLSNLKNNYNKFSKLYSEMFKKKNISNT